MFGAIDADGETGRRGNGETRGWGDTVTLRSSEHEIHISISSPRLRVSVSPQFFWTRVWDIIPQQQTSMIMKAFLEDFGRTIAAGKKQLLAIPEEQAAVNQPGKWSAKQIVGHLIDSAANNHQRFVRAQTTNDLICPGYDQDAWVTTQAYDQESWTDLVQLWSAYNGHLLYIISKMSDDVLTRERKEHNLDVVAFRAVPKNTPTTLEYFVRDYADHMVHHLIQILGHEPAR